MEQGTEQGFSREQFDKMVSDKLRLIRADLDLTQDKMAELIGISKKTLVQVEKGRQTLGFTAAGLTAVLFRKSEIVQAMFGESVLEILDLVSGKRRSGAWYKTMGGKVWWTEMQRSGGFCLQKHVLTGHFRIIDEDHFLHYYSMDPSEAHKRLRELAEDGGAQEGL
ncbi:helix-turn-helix transcriptional regulator [Tumebacillus avium]|nr:helix-turn-helix domain-containing protein [Tumebacillus avium]